MLYAGICIKVVQRSYLKQK